MALKFEFCLAGQEPDDLKKTEVLKIYSARHKAIKQEMHDDTKMHSHKAM